MNKELKEVKDSVSWFGLTIIISVAVHSLITDYRVRGIADSIQRFQAESQCTATNSSGQTQSVPAPALPSSGGDSASPSEQ